MTEDKSGGKYESDKKKYTKKDKQGRKGIGTYSKNPKSTVNK